VKMHRGPQNLKMSQMTHATCLLGVVCHPYSRTLHSLPVYKIWRLCHSIHIIMVTKI